MIPVSGCCIASVPKLNQGVREIASLLLLNYISLSFKESLIVIASMINNPILPARYA